MTVLILGGTAEARALARRLVDAGAPVLSSLAGRVARPALPAGEVRIGGFGGPEGLVRFLQQRRRHNVARECGAGGYHTGRHGAIDAIVDATHPFAAQMSHHAALAADGTGTPLLRLARPGWRGHPLADGWRWVSDLAAARAAADPAFRPFLTTGRQSLPVFAPWADRAAVVRLVDPPETELPPLWRVIRSRGPYTRAAERQLMTDHGVDALITKDSGGDHTVAKLEVATELGIPVVVVSRPAPEPGVPAVATVEEALGWALSR